MLQQFLKLNKITSASDSKLIASYKHTNDSKYIGELFKRYAHLVLGVCMKYLKDESEAQDMTMLIFEKLMNDLRVYDVQNFKSWLYMVTKNQCLLYFRKIKGHETVELKLNNYDDDENTSMEYASPQHPEDGESKEFHLQKIEDGLTKLNPEQKTCLELFYLQNKSYVEVAKITGYNMKQVKSYIQNGKRNLKIYLEKKNA